uniref:Ricin B lectin domain-containing protein n=1 Tax=Mycena chlorophos TaxID=658473 RepID=A0ABQ0LWE5_MYCCL|nr:predicted protein [Mycena chlorophos]
MHFLSLLVSVFALPATALQQASKRDLDAPPNTMATRIVELWNVGWQGPAQEYGLRPGFSGTNNHSFAEVLIASGAPRGNGTWIQKEVSRSENTYTFVNAYTMAPLVRYDGDDEHKDYLFTIKDEKPTIFQTKTFPNGSSLITTASNKSLCMTGIYDGSSMEFGEVALRTAEGIQNQLWEIKPAAHRAPTAEII